MPIKVTKYWSINPSDPDVWHDYSQCRSGKLIPAHNRRDGTPPSDYRRCEHCKDLD